MRKIFFVNNFPLLEKKLNRGISRDNCQYCAVIPGYGKALKILNPTVDQAHKYKHMHYMSAYKHMLTAVDVTLIKLN